MAKAKKNDSGSTIALNKKARHDYHIEERFEAGLVLTGWEVKSLRAGKCQLVDSYVQIHQGEAWLMGTHITPLVMRAVTVRSPSTPPPKKPCPTGSPCPWPIFHAHQISDDNCVSDAQRPGRAGAGRGSPADATPAHRPLHGVGRDAAARQ